MSGWNRLVSFGVDVALATGSIVGINTLMSNVGFSSDNSGSGNQINTCVAIDGQDGPFTFRQATSRGVVGTYGLPGPGETGYIKRIWDIPYNGVIQGGTDEWVKIANDESRIRADIEGYDMVTLENGTVVWFCQ